MCTTSIAGNAADQAANKAANAASTTKRLVLGFSALIAAAFFMRVLGV